MSQNQFVISIMSRDRIGIVRDVASCISGLDGNIADLSQTVLRGYFTMILLATFPEGVSGEKIKRRLRTLNTEDKIPLEFTIFPANDIAIEERVAQENIYMLTASGPDRIGFVAAVATFCAENAINILDLATLVNDGEYVMVLQVDLSRAASLTTVQRQLHSFSAASGIHVVLQHSDIFAATNEITMPV
jgi:glycine cleavage system transcriptional repressor